MFPPRGAAALLGLAVLCAAAGALGDARGSVVGHWASAESILQVAWVGDSLSMQVVALRDPVYLPDEAFGPAGSPRRDDKNPDPAKRQVPILGLELLSDYRFDDGVWRGRIYDPESGTTYSSTMRLGKDGRLRMRGYIGVPMFGRTEVFEPTAACTETILEMIRTAEPAIGTRLLAVAGCE